MSRCGGGRLGAAMVHCLLQVVDEVLLRLFRGRRGSQLGVDPTAAKVETEQAGLPILVELGFGIEPCHERGSVLLGLILGLGERSLSAPTRVGVRHPGTVGPVDQLGHRRLEGGGKDVGQVHRRGPVRFRLDDHRRAVPLDRPVGPLKRGRLPRPE